MSNYSYIIMNIRKIKKYSYLEVQCKALVSGGVGLVHLMPEQFDYEVKPQTGFVIGVLPHEKCFVEVRKVNKKYFHGVLASRHKLPAEVDQTKILHPKWALLSIAPDRKEPNCDSFISCGGCKLLHLDYHTTLQYKLAWLKQHLGTYQIQYPEVEVIPAPKTTHYRNHVQIHINKFKQRGFYSPMTYRVEPFPSKGCLLFDSKLADAHFPSKWELERCMRIRIDENTHHIGLWPLYASEDKNGFFTYSLSLKDKVHVKISIPNYVFFQINSSFIPIWLNIIYHWLDGYVVTRVDQRPIKILELFCGIGFISKILSLLTSIQFIGIDLMQPELVKQIKITCNDLEFNTTNFDDNYIMGDLYNMHREEDLSLLSKIINHDPDVMIANPPRSGLSKDMIHFWMETVFQKKKKTLIYSSCNASTFVRDVSDLQKFGYQIVELKLLDFFPWTDHYEVLALFQ